WKASTSDREAGAPLVFGKGRGTRGAIDETAPLASCDSMTRRRTPPRVAASAAGADSSSARSTDVPRSTMAGYDRTSAPDTRRVTNGGRSPKSHFVRPLRSQLGEG